MADWHDIDKCRVIFYFQARGDRFQQIGFMPDHGRPFRHLPVGIHAIEDIGDFQAVLLPFLPDDIGLAVKLYLV